MLLSPQQGLVVALDADEIANLDALLAAGVVVLGCASYPAPPYFSLVPAFQAKQTLSNETLKLLFPALQQSSAWTNFVMSAMKVPMSQLLKALMLAKPAKTALVVKFESDEKTLQHAISSFFHPVPSPGKENINNGDVLGVAKATFAAKIKL